MPIIVHNQHTWGKLIGPNSINVYSSVQCTEELGALQPENVCERRKYRGKMKNRLAIRSDLMKLHSESLHSQPATWRYTAAVIDASFLRCLLRFGYKVI